MLYQNESKVNGFKVLNSGPSNRIFVTYSIVKPINKKTIYAVLRVTKAIKKTKTEITDKITDKKLVSS